jgi:hypothetical protein
MLAHARKFKNAASARSNYAPLNRRLDVHKILFDAVRVRHLPAPMKVHCQIVLLFAAITQVALANSFQDDSHYVKLGPRTGYYIVRDGSKLSRQLGLYDAPYIDTSDRLRHAYGADVLAFLFDKAGRLSTPPAYIANAEINDFYTRRIGSLVPGRTTVRDVEALFGHPQAVSRRADGVVCYYTINVYNPFEDFGGGRR